MPSIEMKTLKRNRRKSVRRNTEGSVAIEFAFIAPIFCLMIFGIIETSLAWFGGIVLENGMGTIARQIRTGQAAAASMTQAQFRQALCNQVSQLLSCASNRLYIDVTASSNFSGTTFTNPLNPDGTFNTSLNNYNVGASSQLSGTNSIVLVRAFYVWHLTTPLLGSLYANMPGNDRLLSASAVFRNEPF